MAASDARRLALRSEWIALAIVLLAVFVALWLGDLRLHLREDGDAPPAVNLNLNFARSTERARFVELLRSAGMSSFEAERVVRHAGESRAGRSGGLAWHVSSPGQPYLGFDRVRQLRTVPTLNVGQVRQIASQSDSLPLDYAIPTVLDQAVLRRILASAGLDTVWAYAIPHSELAGIHDARALHARLEALTLLPAGTASHEDELGYPITTALMQRTSIDRVALVLQRTLQIPPSLADRLAREILERRLQDPALRPATLEQESVFHPRHQHRDLLKESHFDEVMAVLWPKRSSAPARAIAVNVAGAAELHARLHIEMADAEALVARRSRLFYLGIGDDRGVTKLHPQAALANAPAVTPESMRAIESQVIVRARDAHRLWALWATYAAAWLALLAALEWARIPSRGTVAAMALASGLGLIAMNGYTDITRARDFAAEFIGVHAVTSVVAAVLLIVLLEMGRSSPLGQAGWSGPRTLARMVRGLLFGILRSPWVLLIGVVALCLLAFALGFGAGATKINLRLPGISFLPMRVCSTLAAVFAAVFILNNRGLMEHPFRRRFWLAATGAFFLGAGLFMAWLVRDFGSLLVVLLCWTGAYAAIAGRPVKTAILLGAIVVLLVGGYRLVSHFPTLLPNDFYRVRCDMRTNPWNAGHPRSDQLAYALWAQAAGGVFGTQPGQEPTANIPAGHTDMVISVIMQEHGWLGLLVLCAAMTVVFLAFFRGVTSDDRHSTTDVALRIGLGMPLLAETVLMLGGNLGLLPLTGLTLPFASYGNTGMMVDVGSVVLALWLAAPDRSSALFERPATLLSSPMRPAWLSWAWAGTAVIALASTLPAVLHPENVLRHQLYVWGAEDRTLPPPLVEAWLRRSARPGTLYDRTGRHPLSVARMPADSRWNLLRDPASGLPRAEAELLRAEDPGVFDWIRQHPGRHRFYPLGAAGFAAVGTADVGLPRPNASLAVRGLLDGGGDSTARAALYVQRWAPVHGAVGGLDVRLTIDAHLQQRLHQRLSALVRRPGQRAAGLVLDERGRVLAAVSLPALDVNDEERLRSLDPDQERQLACNLALEDDPSAFPRPWAPGSVFKLVTLASWLEHPGPPAVSRCIGHENADFIRWAGGAVAPHRIHEPEHEGAGHGVLDLASSAARHQALAGSCNVFYATMGAQLGAGPLWKTARTELGLRLPDLPDAAAMNADLAWDAFGQGRTTITPLELARVALTIARGGRWAPIHWIEGARRAPTRAGERTAAWGTPPAPLAGDGRVSGRSPSGLSAPVARELREAMQGVCLPGGTASWAFGNSRLAQFDAIVYGKTGTAEMERIGRDGAGRWRDGDVAWFVGVAEWPDGRKHVAVVAVFDAEGMGGRIAAPAAFDALADAHELVGPDRPAKRDRSSGGANRE
jgi:cell division protein FtsW (lipid II flippase)